MNDYVIQNISLIGVFPELESKLYPCHRYLNFIQHAILLLSDANSRHMFVQGGVLSLPTIFCQHYRDLGVDSDLLPSTLLSDDLQTEAGTVASVTKIAAFSAITHLCASLFQIESAPDTKQALCGMQT